MATVMPSRGVSAGPAAGNAAAGTARSANKDGWSWLSAHLGPSVLQHNQNDVDHPFALDLQNRATIRTALKEIIVYGTFMIFFTIMTSRGITEGEQARAAPAAAAAAAGAAAATHVNT